MTPHLTPSQLIRLLHITLGLGGILLLVVYAIHKAVHRARQADPLKSKSSPTDNEATFMIATMQAVIAGLKEQQKELVERNRAAEQRAQQCEQISEIISREMPTGLMIFDRKGFLTQANPSARELLRIDTWVRRRYSEILGPQSILTARVQAGLEAGRTTRWEAIDMSAAAGKARVLKIFLCPYYARSGEIDGVVCLVTEPTPARQP